MAKKKEKWQKREKKLSGEKEEEKEEKVGSRIRRKYCFCIVAKNKSNTDFFQNS